MKNLISIIIMLNLIIIMVVGNKYEYQHKNINRKISNEDNIITSIKVK